MKTSQLAELPSCVLKKSRHAVEKLPAIAALSGLTTVLFLWRSSDDFFIRSNEFDKNF